MQDHAISVIPAEPGYYALDRMITCLTGKDIAINKSAVVAWIIRVSDNKHQSTVEPLCLDALSSSYENEVLHPSGRVVRFGVQTWTSYDEFERETLERHRREYDRKEEIRRRAHHATRRA